VLSSAAFLAEIFVKWIAKWQNCEVELSSKGTALWTENSAITNMPGHWETNFAAEKYANLKDRNTVTLSAKITYNWNRMKEMKIY
jgi:hypothetical protein